MPTSILSELSGLLARERDVCEQLVERLEADRSSDDVHSNGLLHALASLELHRAITAREVALSIRLEGEPRLQELVEQAPEEWAAVLGGHRRALLDLSRRLRALLRAAPVRSEGNVVTLGAPGRALPRSLGDFLA